MAKTHITFAAAALAATLLFATASAQEERLWRPPGGGQGDGEISLYRAPNYAGAHVRSQTAVADLGLNWQIRSIRITRSDWQLCTGPNFGGACQTLRQGVATIAPLSPLARTRSMRPIVNQPPPGGGSGNGPNLRGVTAEFFTQPSQRNQRILACARGAANLACARNTAEQFCRSQGYSFVGNVAVQNLGGRAYLADVLCKRSAN
jgi:Beta/Gamma crystallin